MLKNQKNFIQGDTDTAVPEEDFETAKKLNINLTTKPFKEDTSAGKPKEEKSIEKTTNNNVQKVEIEPVHLKKKDHKTRFLTGVVMGGVNSDAETKNLEQKQDKIKAINNHPYRHLIFTPFVTESTLKKHLSITYRGLVYSVKCLKGPTEKFIKTKQVSLVDPKSACFFDGEFIY